MQVFDPLGLCLVPNPHQENVLSHVQHSHSVASQGFKAGGQLIVQDTTYPHYGGEDLIKPTTAPVARPEPTLLAIRCSSVESLRLCIELFIQILMCLLAMSIVGRAVYQTPQQASKRMQNTDAPGLHLANGQGQDLECGVYGALGKTHIPFLSRPKVQILRELCIR